jgi:general secretion pathway protein G
MKIKSQRKSHAFTLIEIMVVVIILGILAATIIPQFMGTTRDAKVSKAKADVAELQSCLERFYINLDRYPTAEEGLNALMTAPPGDESKWRGPYLTKLQPDPWEHEYLYRYPGVHNATRYDLWSKGDGQDVGKGAVEIGNW